MTETLMDFRLGVMTPELIVVGTAALVSILDLIIKGSRKILGYLSLVSLLITGYYITIGFSQPSYQILGDTFRVDDFSLIMKLLLIVGTFMVLLFSLGSDNSLEKGKRSGEYYYLILTALLGGMIMSSSADLITLFVGLELLSISSYILVGINRDSLASNESSWKYVVLGSVASAFILYGMSFLYGMTGSTNLFSISQKVQEVGQSGDNLWIFILAFFLMLVGFGFKVSTAPFHMWTPDVYQGAITPVTAFLSVVSKVAAFGLVMRVLLIAYLPLFISDIGKEVLTLSLSVLAALSMIVGNIMAIRQTNCKRLLAYSSIAQAGYMLVPFALLVASELNVGLFSGLFYYFLVYVFMTMGAFIIVDLVRNKSNSEDIDGFAGLYKKSPWISACMTFFLISLAGLPITAGFMGKFFIVMSAVSGQKLWLVYIMVLTTVISYYYYFRIIRQIYFRPEQEFKVIPLPITWFVGILVSLVVTVALGLMPDLVLQKLGSIDWVSGFTPAKNVLLK